VHHIAILFFYIY